MASGRQSDISANTSRSLEAGRIVDRRLEAERGDRADTRHGHEPSDLRIITCQLQNLTIEIVGLLLDGLTPCAGEAVPPRRCLRWADPCVTMALWGKVGNFRPSSLNDLVSHGDNLH